MSEIELQRQIEKLKDRIRSLERIPYSGVFVNYSDTSTVTGWTSYTTKLVYYCRTGNIVYVFYNIEGTSDDTATNFTLPFTSNSAIGFHGSARVIDNGGTAVIGYARVAANTATLDVFPTAVGGNWTSSGPKAVRGELFYAVA